jgi:hypothetical protein
MLNKEILENNESYYLLTEKIKKRPGQREEVKESPFPLVSPGLPAPSWLTGSLLLLSSHTGCLCSARVSWSLLHCSEGHMGWRCIFRGSSHGHRMFWGRFGSAEVQRQVSELCPPGAHRIFCSEIPRVEHEAPSLSC